MQVPHWDPLRSPLKLGMRGMGVKRKKAMSYDQSGYNSARTVGVVTSKQKSLESNRYKISEVSKMAIQLPATGGAR